ncbi:Uncharacterised protein [Stenotrophomonas maltophilia]|nr:Uncharacterised protein [Stenotrophomonas maltophilia]
MTRWRDPYRSRSLGRHDSRLHCGRITSIINLCDMAMHELHDLHSGAPIIVCRNASQRLSVWKYACPILDDRHTGSQVSGNRMADVMQPIAERLGHRESLQKYGASYSATEARVCQKLSFCALSEHRVQRAFQDATGQCRLGTYLNEDQQSASPLLVGTGFRFLRRDFYGQVCSSIGSSAQSYGHAPKAVCLAAEPKRSDAEKHRRKDGKRRDNNRPAVPPDDTAVDPQARARAKAFPPAHSLIPLWTRRHSAMPWRTESCHG